MVPSIYMIQYQYVNYNTYYFYNIQKWYITETGQYLGETTVGPFTGQYN